MNSTNMARLRSKQHLFSNLITATESHNHEDVHEEVDDVKVDVEGGKDVLLGAESTKIRM